MIEIPNIRLHSITRRCMISQQSSQRSDFMQRPYPLLVSLCLLLPSTPQADAYLNVTNLTRCQYSARFCCNGDQKHKIYGRS